MSDRRPTGSTARSRLGTALRQAAVIAIVLIVAGGLIDRLRPEEASNRSFGSTPLRWAAVLWIVVLLVDAIGFEPSQLRRLERVPLGLATAIGAAVLVIGLATFDGGSTIRRLVYLVANAAGAVAFWWAILALLWLLVATDRTDAAVKADGP